MKVGISMSAKEGKELMEKKRPGRRPMTPEEKAAAAAERAAEKAKADNLKPGIFVEYQGTQTDMGMLLEAAKADFHAERKRTRITDLKLYVKPEEHIAYYVVNEKFNGKISF